MTDENQKQEQEQEAEDSRPLREKLRDRLDEVDSVSERLPASPSTADVDSLLVNAVAEFVGAITGVITTLLLALTRIVPGTERFWRGLIGAGYSGLHKSTGADVLGHIKVGGEVKIVPLEYDYEKSRYENSAGDYWNAGSEAEYEYRVAGTVPMVMATSSHTELGNHIQAEVAEVIDAGGGKALHPADVNVVLDAKPTAAMPDGGQAQAGQALDIEINEVAGYSDEIVDLSTDADGRVVSMEKFYELYPSVTDPEEMKRQEERGRAAEQDRDMAKMALKFLLIAGGIVAVAELGPPLVEALFGGGGGGGDGGGGGIIPATIALVSSLRRE
jgi:hypothetical protein